MKATKLARPQPNTRQEILLLDLDDDIRAARGYATALAWMTEGLNESDGVVFQLITKSILTHINAIESRLKSI